MGMLTDSFEIQEALSLFRDLVDPHDLGSPEPGTIARNQPGRDTGQSSSPESSRFDVFPLEPATQHATVPDLGIGAPVLDGIEGEFRGDRLENVLIAMCRRGGFTGAVITDDSGLPLAAHNSPVETDRIAAFTSILGGALSKAGRFLEQHGAEYLSMDINYEDKVVVRRFFFEQREMYLLVLCSQEMDERAEIETTIQQIESVLKLEAL